MLKKVELHVHLEGSVAPDLARKLAKRNQLSIPEKLISPDGKTYPSDNFIHFLSVYDQLADLIKYPQDYYDITFDYLKRNAEKGAIYIEMMYSPDHAEKSSGIPSIEHLQAIQQAVDDAEEKHEISGRIIVTAVRHYGAEAAEAIAKTIHTNSVPCVVGFGLGGDEAGYPAPLFKRAYQIANDGGLSCTVHAGEFAGPESMEQAMDTLPIKRIGHGVRGIESMDTLKRVRDKDIALEVCPTSNIFLGLYPDMTKHPLPKLLEMGIKVSINSDDPPFMDCTLAGEYEKVQNAYSFTDAQMNEITKMAIVDSFADQETKKRLIARVSA
ncbi:adenosine deaminase [Legionella sp. W05-934-2]|uniref:adenosine deaminase n=1 Tax=Legionella sp. W05-934-2 TaxID=1198649 RepID=UPI0034633EA3